MTRDILLLTVIVALGIAAMAQDAPKVEVAIDYSYARFSPSHAYINNSFSLNGGGGSINTAWRLWPHC